MTVTRPIYNNQSFAYGATGMFLQNIKEGGQYNKTCKTLWNVIPTVQGIAYKRAGFVGLTISGADRTLLQTVNILPTQNVKTCVFKPQEDLGYVLVFIAGKIISYPIYPQKSQGDIDGFPDNYRIKLHIIDTTFSEIDINNLDFNVGKLQVIVCSTNKSPKVVRLEDDGSGHWLPAIHDFAFTNAPVLRQNADPDNKIYASGLTGNVIINWSKDTLKIEHAGSIWNFYVAPSQNKLWESEIDVARDDYYHYGDNIYQAKTGGKTGKSPPTHNQYGEVVSDGGVQWQFINNGHGSALLTETVSAKSGKFTVITHLPPGLHVTASDSPSPWRWNEPAFSNVRGWPSNSVDHDESLIFSGVNRQKLAVTYINALGDTVSRAAIYGDDEANATDTTIFGSVKNDYSNFHLENPDKKNGFKYTLESKGDCRIVWGISNGRDLDIGTTDGIFTIGRLSDNSIEMREYIKDALSQDVSGIFSSTVLFYVGDNNNSLKNVTTRDQDGARENSSTSNRAPELMKGIKKLTSVETDANHTIALRDNNTMVGAYFDASQNVNILGIYQLKLGSPDYHILDIGSIIIGADNGVNDYVPASGTRGSALLVTIVDTGHEIYGKNPLVCGYINLNQPPANADDDGKQIPDQVFYADQYFWLDANPGYPIVMQVKAKYKTEIVLHKQGFPNPGHPYGDITKGSTVRYVACNTYNTASPPLLNGYAPGSMSIVGPTDALGQPLPATDVEVIYHYKLNATNLKPMSFVTDDYRSLCIINMDILVDVAEQQ